MYEELIMRLLEDKSWIEQGTTETEHEIADHLQKATNAIEKLSKKRVGTWHRVKATQRSYSFVCNSCGSMYPYLTRCCPNCGVEYIDEEPLKEELV